MQPSNKGVRPHKRHYLRALPKALPLYALGFVLAVLNDVYGGPSLLSAVLAVLPSGLLLLLANRYAQAEADRGGPGR